MKILYDYQGLIQRAGGVSRCICEYIKVLKENNDIEIACPLTDNIYLKDILHKETLFHNIPDFAGRYRIMKFIDKLYSTYKVRKNNFDIFHPTLDLKFYYGNIKKPYVLTIHDLIPELFFSKTPDKQINTWLKNKAKAIAGASRIMCVSENTKKDLLKHYNFVNESKVKVVPHGIYPYSGIYKKNDYGNYILFVGTRDSYKNFKLCLKSFKIVSNKHPDIKIICTGKQFTKDELEYIDFLGLKNNVINVGYVKDDELASLYHFALLFIFPSLYEGFGIPILEAFVNKCPACIANVSCFPEIGGNAVSYFNPNDETSMADAVLNIIEDKDYANELRNKGFVRAQKYTWNLSANKVMECYKEIIN